MKTLSRLTHYLIALILLAAFAVIFVTLPTTGTAGPNLTATPSSTPAAQALLPIIRYDPSPTPAVTPTPIPQTTAATLQITPFQAINASTFNPNSFIIGNQSINGAQLTEMRIDLSTTIFPDMVFDPYGTAGDTIAKDLTIDDREGVNLNGYAYEGPNGGGFDVLILQFNGFDAGDRFQFSVDVDPNSIRGVGAPGPGESGSVGGLELVGATVTATFTNGEVLINRVWRMAERGTQGPNHSGAIAHLQPGLPPAPQIEISGLTPPAVIGNANQTVIVTGPAGQPVTVLVVEGGQFTAGVPGGGFEIEPFLANNALIAREYPGRLIRTYSATTGPNGSMAIPITLSKSGPQGGLNIITAAFDNFYGIKGPAAPALVLQLP